MPSSRRFPALLLAALLLCLFGCTAEIGPSAIPPTAEATQASPTPVPPAPTASPAPTDAPAPEEEPFPFEPQPAPRDHTRLSDFAYERPDAAHLRSRTDVFFDEFNAAQTGRGQIEAYIRYNDDMYGVIDSYIYALIGFYRDVNAGTQAELDACEDYMADYYELQNTIYGAILRSEHVAVWESYLGEELTAEMGRAVRQFDPRMTEINRQVARLRNEYTAVRVEQATKTAAYRGGQYTAAQLNAEFVYLRPSDAAAREELMALLTGLMEPYNERCDAIFSDMLALRAEMASLAGYDDYVDFKLSGGSYDAADIRRFIADIRETMVPIMEAVRQRGEEALGAELTAGTYGYVMYGPSYSWFAGEEERLEEWSDPQAMQYDLAMGTLRGILPEMAEMLDNLEELEMLDVFAREGKDSGGFTVTFPGMQLPFIFSSTADFRTIIHEAGHALDTWCRPAVDLQERFSVGPEIAEVHSMAMEMLAMEAYGDLYGDDAESARLSKLYERFQSILLQTMYYEFELTLYERPDFTRRQRNDLYARLRSEYGLDIPGVPTYDDYGADWVSVSHLFESPLYMIDYSLAQLVSMEIYTIGEQDYGRAKEVYMDFLLDNAELDLRRRLGNAGLHDPFDRETIDEAALWLRERFLSEAFWAPIEKEVRGG